MPDAVIFDMDGTLIDTERVSQTAWRRAAADLGLEVPERIWNAFVGCSLPNARKMVNDEFGDPALTDRLFTHQHELFFQIEDEELTPCTGALEALRTLTEAGLTVALATSTSREHALPQMERFGMAPYFTSMTFGDEITRAKPEPDIYLEAARRLGLDPTLCAAVEDSVNGARAALAAGMATYLVPEWATPTDDLRAGCAAILDSLLELPAVILGDGEQARPSGE
ncbi:HAD family phosphatase [Olsenella profusa]|uniref:HAD family phosphatase n=2 Tax=Olsenella profusa TaxID=138595 RepID=A0ABS2F523_9ACTN|nr:HAD family phosphatase [Olsenella profusa]